MSAPAHARTRSGIAVAGLLRPAANDDGASVLDEWAPLLSRLSIGWAEARAIEARASAAAVSFEAELLASGRVDEDRLYRALADDLGLRFMASVDPEALVIRQGQCIAALGSRRGIPLVRFIEAGTTVSYLMAPARIGISAMRDRLRRRPGVRSRVCVTTPSVLRAALAHRAEPALARNATDGLHATRPDLSARVVVNAWQGAVLGAALAMLPFCLALAWHATAVAVHCVATVFFLSCVALRLVVAAATGRERKPGLAPFDPTDMPVYTVLVALYREADVVPDLLVALGRLVWPRSKLEIKLVCEADDEATLGAIAAHRLRSNIEIVKVPPSVPRTKPKALSYALPMTTGEFVVLYDAEDKPHPFQLVEAFQHFRRSGDDLACLQAPLHISNIRESGVSALFGLEYAALFRGILPWLARRNLFLPLGGTSNHFRRSALDGVGAWDPCNVTEDADLGLRLRRFGYRTGTISYPTFEDAPADVSTWLPQRTRWFKGWAQTWLVHMRNPARLAHELGFFSFLMTQVLVAGMLVSALIHPLFLATIAFGAANLAFGAPFDSDHSALLALDMVNISCGYVAFLVLGWQTSTHEERRGFTRLIALTPVYWTMMSVAAWRSLWQLYRRPFFWAKTPHRPRRRKKASGAVGRITGAGDAGVAGALRESRDRGR